MANKVKSLELQNWKSLKSVALEFDDINVLIGPNGSGKSNLVQFFQMLNMMMSGNLALFIGRGGKANSFLHYGAKTSLFVDSKLSLLTENAEDIYSFRLIHGAPDVFIFGSEKIVIKYNDRPDQPFEREFGAGRSESFFSDPPENAGMRFVSSLLSRIRYFQFHDTSSEAHIRNAASQTNNRSLFHNGGNVASVLLRLQNEFPDLYREITMRLRASIPAFRHFELEAEHGAVLLNWTDSARGEVFGPHQLSDGSIRLVALHTLLALPSSMAPEVIIIDEPELGLFPRAIEVLADAIREASERHQIILATQSNRLVRYLNLPSVICCSWRDGVSAIEKLSPMEEFEFMDNYTLGNYIER